MIRLALAVLALFATAGIASAAPVDPDQYLVRVRAALIELQRGGAPAAPAVARQLRELDGVTAAGDGTIHPENGPVLQALEATPPNVPAALAGLRALLVELEQANGAGAADPAARLEAVVARPEFRPDGAPDLLKQFFADLWNDFWRAVRGQLGDRVPDVEAPDVDVSPALPWIGVFALAAAGLAVFVALRRNLAPRAAPPAVEPVRARDSAGWRAEADRLAAAGDYRGAVQAIYLATLRQADEAGWLRFDATLTNREVLAQVGSRDRRRAESLRPLVDRFDRFWYRGAPGTPVDYAEVTQLARHAAEGLAA